MDRDGAFAEFIAMPASNVMHLDGIPTDIGAIMDPIGNAVHTALEGGDVAGATALVTGANSGIGKATSRALAALGATVLMTVRDGDRGETARREILAALSTATSSRGVRRLQLVRGARLRR